MTKRFSVDTLLVSVFCSMLILVASSCFAENRTDQLSRLFLDAIRNEDLVTAQAMLDSGADINYTNGGEVCALALVLDKDIKFARYLISHGANVNARFKGSMFNNDLQMTPLLCSVGPFNSSIEFARLLVENGADVNAVNAEGKSVLHFAMSKYYGSREARQFLAYLISKGANLNKVNIYTGETPVHVFASFLPAEKAGTASEYLSFIKYLISKGADVNIKANGNKVIDFAFAKGNIPVYQYLLALEQGKVSPPTADSSKTEGSVTTGKSTLQSTIPVEEVNIGWIAPGQTMKHVEEVYGKPAKSLENDNRLLYMYKDGRFVVSGDKEGNEYRVATVLCYQDTQQTPSGFKVGMPFKNVTDKYGTTQAFPVKSNEPFFKEFGLKGCKKYYYVGGNSLLAFLVDKNNIIKSIQFVGNLDS